MSSVALGVTWVCCLHRLGEMECSFLRVLVTDYSPWEREKKQVSGQIAQLPDASAPGAVQRFLFASRKISQVVTAVRKGQVPSLSVTFCATITDIS